MKPIISSFDTRCRRVIRWRKKRLLNYLVFCLALCCVYKYIKYQSVKTYVENKNRLIRDLQHASYALYNKSHQKKDTITYQTCTRPHLALWNRDIENYIEPMAPIICDKAKGWVYTKKGKFFISDTAIKLHGDISCTYTPYVNKQDESVALEPVEHFVSGSRLVSDTFKASCIGTDGRTYERFHACIAKNEDTILEDKSTFPFNVFMLGLDSISRMMIMRLLPKTYEYFTESLSGEVLEGYNILGDGTPAALMPILTGEQETEIAEVRRGYPEAVFVDEALTFIWKRFEKKGYVTQWAEDQPDYSTFNLRMLGFKNQPVHHYMRTFNTLIRPQSGENRKYCYGSKAKQILFLDWLKEGLTTNRGRRFFTLGFLSDFSHDDNNRVRICDNDLTEFMMFMNSEGFLNNTVFLFFSDHGARHGSLRATEQGRLEERMPFVGLYLPESFKTRFPDKVKALRVNTKRLTSPFDIHETLIEVLNDQSDKSLSHTKNRGISLFKEISVNRACSSVGIEPHWCTCMQWKPISVADIKVVTVVEKVVSVINDWLNEYRDICHLLNLYRIQKVVVGQSNELVLKFKGSSDGDGRVPDLNGKLDAEVLLYRVTFQTSPGMGLFEATVRSEVKTGLIHVHERDISRLNWYGKASECVTYKNPELRPYCVCM